MFVGDRGSLVVEGVAVVAAGAGAGAVAAAFFHFESSKRGGALDLF
jgi:hypothetical protein